MATKLRELYLTAQERPLNDQELEEINQEFYGLEKTLGIRYSAVGPEEVVAEIDINDSLVQPAGLVHGGVYSSLVESAASFAAMIHTGNPILGVNNSTDFLSSAHEGTLRAAVTPLQVGSRTQVWQVDITQGERLIARGTLRTMSARQKN